jgi:hypothetical protein
MIGPVDEVAGVPELRPKTLESAGGVDAPPMCCFKGLATLTYLFLLHQ